MNKPIRSLTQYVKDKKRASCPVCALSPEVRKQLRQASEKGITRAEVLAWLAEECGAKKLSDADLSAHANGRHDLP